MTSLWMLFIYRMEDQSINPFVLRSARVVLLISVCGIERREGTGSLLSLSVDTVKRIRSTIAGDRW